MQGTNMSPLRTLELKFCPNLTTPPMVFYF
jgi:hypothetical protein